MKRKNAICRASTTKDKQSIIRCDKTRQNARQTLKTTYSNATMKTSITRLTEYAQRMKSQPEAIRPDAVRLQLINIELTRETAEWILADLAKRDKRLQMCVDNPNTRPTKREKREAELSRLAYAVDAINRALNN